MWFTESKEVITDVNAMLLDVQKFKDKIEKEKINMRLQI